MKRIVFFALLIFLGGLIVNLSFSILTLWSKKDVLISTEKQLIAEKQEHQRLVAQWQQVNTTDFVEEQARDKLFLGQPGESVVLFPQATPSGSPKQQGIAKPVWLQWWELFF